VLGHPEPAHLFGVGEQEVEVRPPPAQPSANAFGGLADNGQDLEPLVVDHPADHGRSSFDDVAHGSRDAHEVVLELPVCRQRSTLG
jgi:hypothetical protein